MKLGVLGLPGSGKTTLLGALMHHLARGGAKESSLAYHGLAGAESFRDLFGHAEALEKGGWPERTSAGRVVEHTLQLRERATGAVLELTLPEMSGALLEEVWRTDRLPGPIAFLGGYQGLVLLVDATVAAPERGVAQHVHLLQAIKRAQGGVRSERSAVPVALVFTKWDALPEAERALPPLDLARTLLPLLVDYLESNHTAWKVFGVSAVGATDAVGKPLLRDGRLRPVSLLAPFEWALERTRAAAPRA